MKAISFLLIVAILTFSSWYKPEKIDLRPSQLVILPGSPQQPDSLTGKEFVFDSLVWIPDENRGVASFDMESESFFKNPNRNIEILFKEYGGTDWNIVVRVFADANYQGYMYNIYSNTLHIWPSPANPFVIGKYFSLRIKFLL